MWNKGINVNSLYTILTLWMTVANYTVYSTQQYSGCPAARRSNSEMFSKTKYDENKHLFKFTTSITYTQTIKGQGLHCKKKNFCGIIYKMHTASKHFNLHTSCLLPLLFEMLTTHFKFRTRKWAHFVTLWPRVFSSIPYVHTVLLSIELHVKYMKSLFEYNLHT